MSETTAQELRNIGERLIAIADSLAPDMSTEKELTYEEVRKVLAGKARDGHSEEIKNLLIKHGVEKLSELNSEEYPALLKEVEVLG